MPTINTTMNDSIIYALDFDGVICDSAVETAITGWKAAATIWNDMPEVAPNSVIAHFREVRPIIETGYEAILVIRLLHLGETTESIYGGRYADQSRLLLQQARLTIDDLKKLFGETRDRWISADMADWIAMNPLYPGMVEKLRRLGQRHTWYVITTKQERFVKNILQANAIELVDERIFGLDRNMSKLEVLNGLRAQYPGATIHFVEDRLPALQSVQKYPELADVKLSFALWGYNTVEDKAIAAQQGFVAQQLETFLNEV